MFKSVLFVALCLFALAKCHPMETTTSNDSHPMETTTPNDKGDVHRAARSAQLMTGAMQMAGQMANRGIDAAAQGMNILSTAAQQAVSAGTSIAADAAKGAVQIMQK